VENYNGWFDKGELRHLSLLLGQTIISNVGEHGVNGDLHIERPPLVPLTNHSLRAGQEMGFSIRDPNVNGPQSESWFNTRHFKSES
jgi:hypothetical protein